MPRSIDEVPEEALSDVHLSTVAFVGAAGPRLDDAVLLAQRFPLEDGFRWDESESWIVRTSPGPTPTSEPRLRLVAGGLPWLTRLWCAPSGTAWISSMEGVVWEDRPSQGAAATGAPPRPLRHALGAPLSGVWGLDDRRVYAWSETRERLWRFDGATWREMPCPGRLLVLAGLHPDDLIAGGYGGELWRWDGQTWRPLSLRPTGTVVGLTWADAEHAYACTLDGEVVEMSPYGAQILARTKRPFFDVLAVNDDLWLAGGQAGLWRVASGTNRVELLSDEVAPERFSRTGSTVLMAADVEIAETQDGETFAPILSAEAFLRERAHERPLWLPALPPTGALPS